MRKESRFHQEPSQTTPDVYAARHGFAPRDFMDGHSYHQWGINLTFSGHCRWQSEAGELCVGVGDVLINRPYTWRSWRVYAPEPPGAREGGRHGESKTGWDCAWAHFHPRPHWH